jgi:hypothetical protein
MHKTPTFFAFVFIVLVSSSLYSQIITKLESEISQPKPGVTLNFSVGDTNFLRDLIHGDFLESPLRSFFNHHDSTEDDFWAMPDSTNDSVILDMKVGDFTHRKKHRHHSFIITEPPYDREIPYLESMPFMDFNRVNGFYLGIATPTMMDFGLHDEFGIKGGIGYGFEDKKGQSQIAGEYRIPLRTNDTSIAAERWKPVPTLAVGAEYHDVTTTDDAWRTQRGENSVYAFLVREDFRDYFKVEGWNAYLALRPDRKSELRLEYRSDEYSNKPQLVFHGRWGGRKNLPMNPSIDEGTFHSWVVTAVREEAHSESLRAKNVFGDSTTFTRMTGRVYMLQAEFGSRDVGNMEVASSSGYTIGRFQRYILDARDFNPIFPGLSIDTRFRMESGTGDMPFQKLEFLGGPSSLPALKNKIIEGNRLVLLNTEVRLSLALLSTFFQDNPELIILNDFGFCKRVSKSNNLLQGFGDMTFSTIAYNIGVGLGHPSGIQLGVSWRTDIKEAGRFFFRFQRPF